MTHPRPNAPGPSAPFGRHPHVPTAADLRLPTAGCPDEDRHNLAPPPPPAFLVAARSPATGATSLPVANSPAGDRSTASDQAATDVGAVSAGQIGGRSFLAFTAALLGLLCHAVVALTCNRSQASSPPPLPRPRSRWQVRRPALIAAGLVISMVVLLIGFSQSTADSDPAPDPQTSPAPQVSPASQTSAVSQTAPVSRFSWPLPPPHQLLRPFQPPATQYGPGHRGVDLTGSVGEPVLAAGDGLVLFSGPIGGCDLISIEHPGGLRTTYEPVDPLAHVGQQVTTQQIIGHLQAARPDCPQEVTAGSQLPPVFLYWGVHRDRTYLDPIRLIESGRIRLLPWGDGR